jgi:hypothetical protein
VADEDGEMRGDEGRGDLQRSGTESSDDLSFAAFSLTHAECGESVIELRLSDRLLLGWCLSCAVLETFGSLEE